MQAEVNPGDTAKTGAERALERSAEGERVTVQIKLQEESEIAEAALWQRGDRVVIEGN